MESPAVIRREVVGTLDAGVLIRDMCINLRTKAIYLVKMLAEACKNFMIHRETSTILTWDKRPLSKEEAISPKATEKDKLQFSNVHRNKDFSF